MTIREQLIWAAGYFEGRGGVYLGTTQNPNQVRVIITDRDAERLERFSDIIGAGRLNDVRTGSGRATTSNQWSTGSRPEIEHFIAQLAPFTSGTCRDRLDEALRYMKDHPVAA